MLPSIIWMLQYFGNLVIASEGWLNVCSYLFLSPGHNTIIFKNILRTIVVSVYELQIAEMVTFLLTLVYAVTALFRVIEIYFNDGIVLPPQV